MWDGTSWISQAAYLSGSQIIDGSVNGGKITVGTLVGDRIAANTIQTSRLAIADFDNYAVNGEFTGGNTSWGGLIVTNETPVSTGGNAIQGTNVLALLPAATPSNAQRYAANDNRFAVKAGDQFWFEWAGKASADMDGSFDLHVRVNRPDGSQISTYSVGNITNAITDYTLRSGNITMPTDAHTAFIQIRYNNSTGAGHVGYVRLRKRNGGELIIDGSIRANHIETNSITTNKMLIGDTTNYTENSNFQAGNVGWTPVGSATIIQDVVNAYNGGSWVGRFAPTSLAAFRNAAIMTVTAGDELYAYAYIKTTDAAGGSCYLRLSYINAAGSEFIWPQSPIVGNQPNYGKVELTSTVPPLAVGARLEIVGNMGSTGKVIWIGAVGLLRRQTGNLIVDGAIQTRHLTSRSVTANELAVGDFTNLAINGDYSLGMSSWDASPGVDVRQNASIGYKGSKFYQNRTPQAQPAYSHNQNRIAVQAGEEFWFEWIGRYIGSSGNYAGTHYGVIDFYDTNDAIVGEFAAGGVGITPNDPAGWKVCSGAVTVPTGAAFARIGTYYGNTTGNAAVAFLGLRRRNSGNLLVDGSVSALQLSANSVTALKIAAGAVTASKLYITDMTNLVPDSTITETGGWIAGIGSPSYTIVAGNAGYAGNYISIPTKAGDQQVVSLPIPVEPKQKYYASALISTANTGVTGRVHLTWYSDLAGTTYITDSIVGLLALGYQGEHNNRVKGQFAAPNNAKSCRIIFTRMNGGTGQADFAEPIVKRATSGELIVDGTIQGVHIKGETITGDHLEIGTIKAAQIGAGEVIVSKLAVGSSDNIVPDSDYRDPLWWSGTADQRFSVGVSGLAQARRELIIAPGGGIDAASQFFPVETGAVYKVSVSVYTRPDFNGTFRPVLHMPAIQWCSLKNGAACDPLIGNANIDYTAAGQSFVNSFVVTNGLNVEARQWQFRFVGSWTGSVAFQVSINRVSDNTLIANGAVTTEKMIANTIAGDRITAGTLSADRLVAGSVIAGNIVISGTTGTIAQAAQTAVWTGVGNRPTNLAALNSAEGTKLGGIAAGATVGGTIGTNIKDSSGVTLNDADLMNSQSAFQPLKVFTFDGGVEGCTFNGSTAAVSSGILTMTATTGDPFIRTPALNLPGAKISTVRLRARPLSASPTWDGACYYQTTGHGDTASYYKRLRTPTLVQNQWMIFEWDMTSLTAGGTDFVTNTIINIRIDLANSQQHWEIDWLALGNSVPAGTYVGDLLATEVSASVANITNDDVVSPAEKTALFNEHQRVLNEETYTYARLTEYVAAGYGLDFGAQSKRDEMSQAKDQVTAILAGVFDNMAAPTNVIGATVRSRFQTFYGKLEAARIALQNLAARSADWAAIGGAGKPETYTVSARSNATTNLPGNYSHGMRDSGGNVIVDGLNAAGLRSDRYARSYSVLWKHDGVNWAVRHFDVYGGSIAYPDSAAFPSNSTGMAALLNAIAPGVPVIIYTSDEPATNRLTGGLPAAIYRCGGSKAVFASPNFTSHSSYILMGQAGVGEGNGVELFSAGGANSFVRGSFSIINGVMTVGGQSIKDAKDIVFSDGRGVDDLRGVAAGATVGAPTGTNVGSTPAATVESRANNPAARINEATTTIAPGKITIQGATTLDSWRDQTEIRGGAIKANTIDATKLTLNNRGVNFINIEFYVSADKRYLYWTEGHAHYIDDNGSVQTPAIGNGGCDALTNTGAAYYYIFWIKGQPLLSVSINDPAAAMGSDRILLCTWTRGTSRFNANFGSTIVHGDQISTGTLDANRIKAGTVISNLVQVENTGGMGNLGDAIVRANDPAARINSMGTTIAGGKITTGSITALQIGVESLSAISANIGLIRTAPTGQRSELDNNGLRVYDANGTLRVRLGVW